MVRGTGIEAGWQDGIGGKIELDLKGSCCSMNERSDCPEAIESMARQIEAEAKFLPLGPARDLLLARASALRNEAASSQLSGRQQNPDKD